MCGVALAPISIVVACASAPVPTHAGPHADGYEQAPVPADSTQAKSICFRGRPQAYCRSFILTQARFQIRPRPETATPTRCYLTADVVDVEFLREGRFWT